MEPEIVKQLAEQGPTVLILAIFAYQSPTLIKEYLAHRRERAKIMSDERRKEARFAEQIEAARQKRISKDKGIKK